MIWAFDVDGTLTPSRQLMDQDFKAWFMRWCKTRRVVLVTGSDYVKTSEQVGHDLAEAVERVHCCAGNSVWEAGREVWHNEWQPDRKLLDILDWMLHASIYPERCGVHEEFRPGMLNFSIVGRNCTLEQRQAYHAWDQQHGERAHLCSIITRMFPELDAQVGGEISIDIFPRGRDKSQLREYYANEPMTFFGDGIEPGKNDWPLASLLTAPSQAVSVKGWQDTLAVLRPTGTPLKTTA